MRQSGRVSQVGKIVELVSHNIDLSVERLVRPHWACIRQILRRETSNPRAVIASKTNSTMTTRISVENSAITAERRLASTKCR
jgi:hypothetical protein